ncbi:MAG: (2Fe-2S) ferredoxin domain-containing protein [Oligoflexia bacterium]|nr:(2Fe-2S) ferredoxin domain-containing protein [Oligoflexia bacterium]
MLKKSMESQKEKSLFEQHLFICTRCQYIDSEGRKCGEEVAPAFRKEVKKLVKEKFPHKKVRVNASGCLGQCEQGISAVLYPEAHWELDLRPGDEDRLISLIK